MLYRLESCGDDASQTPSADPQWWHVHHAGHEVTQRGLAFCTRQQVLLMVSDDRLLSMSQVLWSLCFGRYHNCFKDVKN